VDGERDIERVRLGEREWNGIREWNGLDERKRFRVLERAGERLGVGEWKWVQLGERQWNGLGERQRFERSA
jgi:hypothetical protein